MAHPEYQIFVKISPDVGGETAVFAVDCAEVAVGVKGICPLEMVWDRTRASMLFLGELIKQDAAPLERPAWPEGSGP